MKITALFVLAWSWALQQAQQPASVPIYDVLLKNAQVVDSANRRTARLDVALGGKTIVRIAPGLPAVAARVTIDLSCCYVSAGLVDLNAHIDSPGAWLNVNPDHHALRSGVTTVVDGGSTGARTFERFRSQVIARSKTRILAFLNIASGGLRDDRRAVALEELDPEEAVRMAQRYPDVIVGIRTPPGDAAGWEGVERAIKAAERSGRIVMADFHAAPAGGYDELVGKRLRKGDLATYVYGAGTPLLDRAGRVRPALHEARARGILFDLGHGSEGFWLRVAAPAVKQVFLPDTISSGMDKESLLLPRATMTVTLSKLLNLGMSLEQLVERATILPARVIGRPELGSLREGGVADLAVFEIERGRFGFLDSGRARLTADRSIRAVMTIRAGEIVWDADGRSRTDWQNAGPYSNYR
ncbi:MAG: amidohydrolase family protein [Gammaproteobacteria bacterium]